MADAPTARIVASAPVAQSSTSSVCMTLSLETVVEQVETRLKRLEKGHSSLPRRVVNQREVVA
jgi:hypothetical protein